MSAASSVRVLVPHVPHELLPGILVSSSSEAGVAAAARLGATTIEQAKPAAECAAAGAAAAASRGIRIGIIARSADAEAWRIAHSRFPPDTPAAEQYLVGSYSRVAHSISGYVRAGYRTFLLDVLANAEELRHIGAAFGAAADSLAA